MPGLVPGIHVFVSITKKDVDGRDEPGHDDPFERPNFVFKSQTATPPHLRGANRARMMRDKTPS